MNALSKGATDGKENEGTTLSKGEGFFLEKEHSVGW